MVTNLLLHIGNRYSSWNSGGLKTFSPVLKTFLWFSFVILDELGFLDSLLIPHLKGGKKKSNF